MMIWRRTWQDWCPIEAQVTSLLSRAAGLPRQPDVSIAAQSSIINDDDNGDDDDDDDDDH